MPKVQGRITIRRRPKDGTPGTPGADSVRYWIQPSATSIAMTAPEAGDATPVPGTVSVAVRKQIGNQTPTNVSIASEGLSLKYMFTRNGVVGNATTLATNLTIGIPTNTEFNNVIVQLFKGTTMLDSVTIPFLYDGEPGKDGKDGDDGADGVSYSVILTPNSISVKSDGTVICDGDSVQAVAYKNVGGVTSEAKDGSMKLLYTKMDGTKSEIATSGITADAAGLYANVSFEYRVNNKTVASAALVINREGGKGDPGNQGIQGCIYRITQWQEGREYRNDSALTSGLRYIDVALIPNPALATKAEAFMCKKTHSPSSSSNSPKSSAANTYWTTLNSTAPFFLPFLLADGAAITLLQSNQVLVMKEDGSTVNVALGGGKYPLWIGHSNPTEANLYVDDLGRAHMSEAEIIGRIIAGIAEGQRVELQPDNKAMKIYDANGDEVCSFEGNSYTKLTELFSSASGSFNIKNRTITEFGFASGTTFGKGTSSISGNDSSTVSHHTDVTLSDTIQSSTPIEVTINGYLETHYSVSADYAYNDNPYNDNVGGDVGVNPPTIQTEMLKPVMSKHASASLGIYIETYSDAALTKRIGSVYVAGVAAVNGGKSFSNVKAKTSVGGYHVIKLSINMSASGSGMSASVKWGSAVSGKSNISGSYLSDFYVSRYFANGFCLGMSATNYIWAYNQGAAGMRFVMENGGFGIDVSNSGIKYKHHSGNWLNMPLLVFSGRAYNYTNSNTIYYAWATSKSFNSNLPTLTRLGEGQIKVVFPEAWVNAGITFSNCIINVVGYGTVNGSSDNPVKAQIFDSGNNYVTISISDDASENDGSFMIQIYAV